MTPRSLRPVRTLLAVVLCLLFAGSAYAEKVALVKVDGPRAKAVQKTIVGQLRKDGHKVSIVDSADDADDADGADGAAAIVTATIEKKGKRWQVRIVVVNAADEEVLGKTTLRARRAKSLPKLVRKLFRKRLGKAVKKAELPRAEPEPEPEPEPVVEDEPEPEPAVESDDADSSDSARPSSSLGVRAEVDRGSKGIDAHVGVSGRIFSRRFAYKDDLFDALAEYKADVTPAIVVSADAYFGRFGAAAELAYTRPFDSRTDDEVAFPTETVGYTVGGRYRLLTGATGAGLGVDYGARDMSIEDAPSRERPDIPDVAYRFVRASASAHKQLGTKLTAGAEAGYRHVLSAGEIESAEYFPRLSVAGVDATAWVGYDLAATWRVQVAANMERYFFAMNPEPGDARIAGGATDQFLGVQIGLVFRQ